jgi:hypothetical protein
MGTKTIFLDSKSVYILVLRTAMYGQPLRLPQSRTAIAHGVHGATARVARTSGVHFSIRVKCAFIYFTFLMCYKHVFPSGIAIKFQFVDNSVINFTFKRPKGIYHLRSTIKKKARMYRSTHALFAYSKTVLLD